MTGKYEHTMDAKGRVFVPAKLRERLGSSFHAAIGASRDGDGEVCRYLALYPGTVSGFVSVDSAPLSRKYFSGWELALLKNKENDFGQLVIL